MTVIAQEARTHVFCFSHLRWGFVYQRPQHIMSRAARKFKIWFFEEPLFSNDESFLKISEQDCGVRVVTPILPDGLSVQEQHAALRKMLVGLLSKVQPRQLISWYYTPMALDFTDELLPDLCVYDNMDELSGFVGAPANILDMERRLLDKCDVVFVGGRSLYRAKRDSHDNIHVFPSSVDAAHFSAARAGCAEPADQSAIPGPRLGFFGVIDERMNLDLVAAMAALRPQWRFVMVGPTVKIDPVSLPRAENIHWLGCKAYAELPAYLSGWDVGVMPFALNDATRFISPTKTPEFLAAGVPVVSTPIADVVEPYGVAGHVEIAQDAEGFVACAETLMRRPKAPWLTQVDESLADMSWDKTWSQMTRLLAGARAKRKTLAEARHV